MPVQRVVDNVLAVAKESVKTFTYEAVNNIVRLINGMSALLLAILPGKTSILEGMSDWELRPTFRAPKLPRWMEDGVSSFNQFIHNWSVDSDTCSGTDYSSEEEYSDESTPGSPISHSSHFSRASSFSTSGKHWIYWIRYMLSWIMLPVKILLGIPSFFCKLFSYQGSNGSSNPSLQPPYMDSPGRLQSLKEHVIQRATDKRRGVVEDLHVAIEIFIESVFDFFHKASRCLLAPLDTFWVVLGWFSSGGTGPENYPSGDSGPTVTTTTLSETDPTLTERKVPFYHSLNSDVRTCQDVITELGYPYEAIHVVTSDGYVLLLERIPRRDSRKVAFLQHGVFDSSMGWVSNGVVGSPAFAAYDQGFDVFLGNLRGLVSREHVDKNISSRQYWRYSINELGTEDIPAMIAKIHEIKVSELGSNQTEVSEESNNDQPYKLCAICHSLGGAAILIYIITRRILEVPHRLSRMILLSPAGFHHDSTFAFTVVEYMAFLIGPLVRAVFPALYIPSRLLRMLINKLARDLQNLPAVGGLVQTVLCYIVGGDCSNWVGVLGLPHYNMNDMPAVSMGVVLHLAQIKRARRFMMFDYGSAEANMKAYGSPEPLDLGEYYQLIDIPVDLVAGRKDRVIRSSMVKKHYRLMKAAGVQVSYNEFEYAHLDFTFSHREELLNYVMSRLSLILPSKNQNSQKSSKLKKRNVKSDNITQLNEA